MKNNFKISDFLILNLCEEIESGKRIIQGTSTFIPLVATILSMKNKSSEFIGGFMSNPQTKLKIPSTFCPENYSKGKYFWGLSGFLDLLNKNRIDLEFLRPAQIDRFGNMNNTLIKKEKHSFIRLPGGMGIDDVMTFAKRIIVYVPNHNKKVFVKKVDFVTAHGWNKGKGPDKIITNLGVFEFIDKRTTLTKINPLSSIEEIKKNTGFKFKISKKLKKMKLVDEKTRKEIEKIDPKNLRGLEIKEERDIILNENF
jgi:glutaconate CoA-transferase subunit B